MRLKRHLAQGMSKAELSVPRLCDEVRTAGCAGGYGRVRDCVRKVRPRDPVGPLVRFETPLSRQGQSAPVDFGA